MDIIIADAIKGITISLFVVIQAKYDEIKMRFFLFFYLSIDNINFGKVSHMIELPFYLMIRRSHLKLPKII